MSSIDEILRQLAPEQGRAEEARRVGQLGEELGQQTGTEVNRKIDPSDIFHKTVPAMAKLAAEINDHFKADGAAEKLKGRQTELTQRLDEIDAAPPEKQWAMMQKLRDNVNGLEKDLGFLSKDKRDRIVRQYEKEYRGRVDKYLKKRIGEVSAKAKAAYNDAVDVAYNQLVNNPYSEDEGKLLEGIANVTKTYIKDPAREALLLGRATRDLKDAKLVGMMANQDRAAVKLAVDDLSFKGGRDKVGNHITGASKSVYARASAFANRKLSGPALSSLVNKNITAVVKTHNLQGLNELVVNLKTSEDPEDKKNAKIAGFIQNEIKTNIKRLNRWAVDENKLNAELKKRGFSAADGLVWSAAVAELNRSVRLNGISYLEQLDPEARAKLTHDEAMDRLGTTNRTAEEKGESAAMLFSGLMTGNPAAFAQYEAGINEMAAGNDLHAAEIEEEDIEHLRNTKAFKDAFPTEKEQETALSVYELLKKPQGSLAFNPAEAMNAIKDKGIVDLIRSDAMLLKHTPDRFEHKTKGLANQMDFLRAAEALATSETIKEGTERDDARKFNKERQKKFKRILEDQMRLMGEVRTDAGRTLRNTENKPVSFPSSMLSIPSVKENLKLFTRTTSPANMRALAKTGRFDKESAELLNEPDAEVRVELTNDRKRFILYVRDERGMPTPITQGGKRVEINKSDVYRGILKFTLAKRKK